MLGFFLERLIRQKGARSWKEVIFFFSVALSHPSLDALTNGGRGVALFWPFTNERFFFPWRPIEVSPIGIFKFFGPTGQEVVQSELLWIGLPTLLIWLYAQTRKGKAS